GSSSSSPACFSSWNVACFVAMTRMLTGEGAGALPEDARLPAGEVDHRGRDAGKLASVDDRAAGGADLLRDVLDPPRIGAAREVRARRGDDADRTDDRVCFRWQIRDADTDVTEHE